MDENDYFQAQVAIRRWTEALAYVEAEADGLWREANADQDGVASQDLRTGDAAVDAVIAAAQAALELLSDSDASAFDADRVECMLNEALELLASSKGVDKSV